MTSDLKLSFDQKAAYAFPQLTRQKFAVDKPGAAG